MKTPRLETDRLLLREVQENDVEDIFDCWMKDEEVSRYMCWKASDDISYNLGKKFLGKGYVTEAMKMVMQFAQAELGMKECLTSYAKVNSGSANVLHKLGFVDEKEIPYECNGGDIITEGIMCRYIV